MRGSSRVPYLVVLYLVRSDLLEQGQTWAPGCRQSARAAACAVRRGRVLRRDSQEPGAARLAVAGPFATGGGIDEDALTQFGNAPWAV